MRCELFGMMLVACGGATVESAAPSHVPSEAEADPAPTSWASDLFPPRVGGEVRIDRYGRHAALVYGGRVYGSNGDDMPSQMMLALYPALLRDGGLTGRRVALIGIGSGVELGVLLRVGAGVDLYEPDDRLLANAFELAHDLGVAFEDGGPVHPRLRIFGSLDDVPATAVVYDAIVHSNASTVINRPPALYTVERFERLLDRLAPDGIVAIHLQLYEILDAMHRRLLATFAAASPHVVVFAPENLSSDSYLFGSRSALALSLASIDRVFETGELVPIVDRVGWSRRLDPAVRALFRDRDEVLAHVGDAQPFTEAAPLALADWPVRPATPPPEGVDGSVPDWDDWSEKQDRWSERMGFDEGFIERFYEGTWRFGDPCDAAACPLVGSAGGTDHVDLARSHLAHGQRLRAASRLVVAEQGGGTSAATSIRRVAEALETSRLPTVTPLDLLEGSGGARGRALAELWSRAEDGRASWADVLDLLADVPLTHPPSGFATLGAVAVLRNGGGGTEDAVRSLGVVREDAPYVARHPVVLFWHGRALWENRRYREGFEAMERYFAEIDTTRP